MRIPLFPLSSIVLPGGLLPLRLFERRYLDMVRDCFRQQSGFGVCLVKQGGEVGDAALPYPCGTLIKIIDWDQDDGGLLNIVVQGEQKFRITETSVDDAQLLSGEVELLPLEVPAPVPDDLSYLQDSMQQILRQVAPSIEYQQPQFDDALWLGSRYVELLPVPGDVKHELVAMNDPVGRLRSIADLMAAFSVAVQDS